MWAVPSSASVKEELIGNYSKSREIKSISSTRARSVRAKTTDTQGSR